ncbi:ribosome maturation factor RimP [Parapedomonas caeni]
MADIARLTALIEPIVTRLGYELVRVSFGGGEKRAVLQVMAERPETGQLVIEDCEAISRAISDMLDIEDPIEGEYRLEVSSPGIDRPLTRPKDYVNWAGHEVRITLATPVEGRKRLVGVIRGLAGDQLTVATEAGDFTVPLSAIAGAKLVLTDALIRATAPARPE